MRDHVGLRCFLAERRSMPFAWGRHANDCGSFALAAIVAQTGRDVLPGVTWSTARGAARVMARHGGIEAMTDGALRRITPARAMRGDVASVRDLLRGGDWISLVIVEGEMLAGPGDGGIVRLPRSAMLAAWSVD